MDMTRLKLATMVLTLASAAWAGGNAPAKSAPSKVVTRTTRSDADIEKDIRARFAKSKINAEHFQVHVQGAIASIEGKTDVIQHKGVATRLAKSGGAAAVSNHIEISDAARQKAEQNLESGRRRAQIKRGDVRSEAPVE